MEAAPQKPGLKVLSWQTVGDTASIAIPDEVTKTWATHEVHGSAFQEMVASHELEFGDSTVTVTTSPSITTPTKRAGVTGGAPHPKRPKIEQGTYITVTEIPVAAVTKVSPRFVPV